MSKLKVESLVLGMVETNSYFLINEETKECIFVDPADDADRIIAYIKQKDYNPKGILLTHGHFDHILAADKLRQNFSIPILSSSEEVSILTREAMNLSYQFGPGCILTPDRELNDKEEFKMAGFTIRALLTPGHTAGGMCYYFPKEKVVFSGDTLFMESVGRTDFPTGSAAELENSVRTQLFVLEDDIVVYPGHGPYTSIGHEKQYNPFF